MSPITQPVPRRDATDDEPIRIVIAEDNAVVRDGLRAHVMAQAGLDVIGEATDGEQAWASACALRPDVLLLDLSMPGVSGLEAAERIVADCPAVRIIALTMHEEHSFVARLTQAGAVGYVLKRTASSTLVSAIHVVMNGGSYVDPALREVDRSDPANPPTDPTTSDVAPDEREPLTREESELLRLVAQGRSNGEIAVTLGLSIAAVTHGRGCGMAKLGLHSRAALVRHATERGWLTLES